MVRSSSPRRAASARSLPFSLPLLLALSAPLPGRAADPAAPAPDDPPRRTSPVIVTATRGERDVLDVPGNTSVIEREAIDRSGARSVPELLRREAGLYVTNFTTNPAGTQVEARGFNNGGSLGSGVLVLVDGRRANEADTGNTDWALIPLDDVEKIEIVRGPASASWGDNAVGGVIHIHTRARAGEPRVVLRGAGGSFASGEGSLRLAGSAGPATLTFFAGGLRTDGYRDRSDYDAVDLDADLELQLGERVAWGFGGALHRDERSLPGALTQDEIDALGRRAADPGSSADRADVERAGVRTWIEAQLADAAQLRVQPWYGGRTDDVVISLLGPFGSTTTDIDFDKGSGGLDAELQIDRSLASFANRLLLGSAFQHDATDRDIGSPFGFQASRSDRSIYAFFLQDELSLTEDLMLSGGLRFDRADYALVADDGFTRDKAGPDFDVWSPKAALTYRILPPLAAYFSYAKGFRLPNFDEDAPILPFLGQGDVLLPDLRPQRSESFEIGTKLEADRVRGALALYDMQVRNEIVFDPTTFANENFDRVRHRGIELTLAGQVLAWLELYGSYSFEDVQIRRYDENTAFQGKRMPITPLHRGTLGAVAGLPLGFEGRVNANLVGERHLSNDFANAERELGAYAAVDLFLTWRPPLARVLGEAAEHVDAALTFAVRNVGAEHYEDFGARSDFSDPVFNPAPGRSYGGVVTVTLRR